MGGSDFSSDYPTSTGADSCIEEEMNKDEKDELRDREPGPSTDVHVTPGESNISSKGDGAKGEYVDHTLAGIMVHSQETITADAVEGVEPYPLNKKEHADTSGNFSIFKVAVRSLTLWSVFVASCCCSLSADLENEEEVVHQNTGLSPNVHVTLVNLKNPADIAGGFSITGEGAITNSADSLDALNGMVDDVGAAEETTTVNLGSTRERIDVGVLSTADYKHILAICPSFG